MAAAVAAFPGAVILRIKNDIAIDNFCAVAEAAKNGVIYPLGQVLFRGIVATAESVHRYKLHCCPIAEQ